MRTEERNQSVDSFRSCVRGWVGSRSVSGRLALAQALQEAQVDQQINQVEEWWPGPSRVPGCVRARRLSPADPAGRGCASPAGSRAQRPAGTRDEAKSCANSAVWPTFWAAKGRRARGGVGRQGMGWSWGALLSYGVEASHFQCMKGANPTSREISQGLISLFRPVFAPEPRPLAPAGEMSH